MAVCPDLGLGDGLRHLHARGEILGGTVLRGRTDVDPVLGVVGGVSGRGDGQVSGPLIDGDGPVGVEVAVSVGDLRLTVLQDDLVVRSRRRVELAGLVHLDLHTRVGEGVVVSEGVAALGASGTVRVEAGEGGVRLDGVAVGAVDHGGRLIELRGGHRDLEEDREAASCVEVTDVDGGGVALDHRCRRGEVGVLRVVHDTEGAVGVLGESPVLAVQCRQLHRELGVLDVGVGHDRDAEVQVGACDVVLDLHVSDMVREDAGSDLLGVAVVGPVEVATVDDDTGAPGDLTHVGTVTVSGLLLRAEAVRSDLLDDALVLLAEVGRVGHVQRVPGAGQLRVDLALDDEALGHEVQGGACGEVPEVDGHGGPVHGAVGHVGDLVLVHVTEGAVALTTVPEEGFVSGEVQRAHVRALREGDGQRGVLQRVDSAGDDATVLAPAVDLEESGGLGDVLLLEGVVDLRVVLLDGAVSLEDGLRVVVEVALLGTVIAVGCDYWSSDFIDLFASLSLCHCDWRDQRRHAQGNGCKQAGQGFHALHAKNPHICLEGY
ncbi:hypothetical protein AKJ21_12830 [Corynebacterium glutamicum]|nr:hypothetical protein AKJ21_12830 [Corynebacterium glutamicum]